MIQFSLGMVAGISLVTLVIATLVFFRAPIERKVQQAQTSLQNAGPRARGFIIEPEDEATESRREIVRKNAEQGKDTPISELQ